MAGLNDYLLGLGHSIEVLAAAPAAISISRQKTEPPSSGLQVLRIPSSLFYRGGAPDALAQNISAASEALRFSIQLGRLLQARQRHYDALISHWLVPSGMLASLFARGRPHVAIAHSSDVHLLRRWRLLAMARYVAARARLVYTAESLRIAGAPGVVVPMGIDVQAFAVSAAERRAARKRLAGSAPTVLFLGRLVPVKGVSVLLAAVAAHKALHLWIAGDGPLRAALQREAADLGLGPRVRFFGEVAGKKRQELLAACDVLAVPSLRLEDGRTEGAPQVVLEGLAAGCKVVASAVGGIEAMLADAGWLVPPGEVAALAATLAHVAVEASASDFAKDQQRTYAVARAQDFDWTRIAPEILGESFSQALSAPCASSRR